MDPGNPVIALCSQGMQAEAQGKPADALRLFEQAWDAASDDYEACVAAHYVARHQSTPEQTLHWNKECLDRADKVGDDRVKGFYPSLHLNMAKAYQDLGDVGQARAHFGLAAAHVRDAPEGQYGDWVKFALAEGLRATGGSTPRPCADVLTELVAALCRRADLKALGLILPAYLADLGTEEDKVRLVTALHMVHATRSLPEEEQQALGRAITALMS